MKKQRSVVVDDDGDEANYDRKKKKLAMSHFFVYYCNHLEVGLMMITKKNEAC